MLSNGAATMKDARWERFNLPMLSAYFSDNGEQNVVVARRGQEPTQSVISPIAAQLNLNNV